MKRSVLLTAAAIALAAGAEDRTFVISRAADGAARMNFSVLNDRVMRFDVEVNGVWTGSVAVPKARSRGGEKPGETPAYVIPCDGDFKSGENRVRVSAKGPLPHVLSLDVAEIVPDRWLETSRWQSEIDAAATRGGGRVSVPVGVHHVGGLVLKSNVELHLEKGALLVGAYALRNYPVWSLPGSEGTWSAIVMARNATNIAVTGEGEIFGYGASWPQPSGAGANQEGLRARGLFFADCRNVRLADFTLRDSACWGCVFRCVDGLDVRRVKIDNHSNWNNDGFDIEASNAVFADCDVDASDDAFVFKSNNPDFIVENVLITNCVARSHCNAFKFGTASHGIMRHVKFVDSRVLPPRRDFLVRGTAPHGVTEGNPEWSFREGYSNHPAGIGISALVVECVDGGEVSDVLFENIDLSGYLVPIFIRGGVREGRSNAVPAGKRHILKGITLRNIRGVAETCWASSISGVDGCRAADITLENVKVICRGAGRERSEEALKRPVPDVSKNYPEANMFRHILPAYGLYTDKVDNLKLVNVDFRLRDGDIDLRPAIR